MHQISIEEEVEMFDVYPVFGAIPIKEADRQNSDNGAPIWATGSRGDNTGFARLLKPLPEQAQPPETVVVFKDDVLDSGVTAMLVAIERRKIRNSKEGKSDDSGQYVALIGQIDQMHNTQNMSFDDGRFQPIYSQAARLLRDENVMMMPIYVKNKIFLEEIKKVYNEDLHQPAPPVWAQAQRKAVESMVVRDAHEWIMGGKGEWAYSMLDTGVEGQEILAYIEDENLKRDLIIKGFDRLYLRIGAGLEGLIAFNPDRNKVKGAVYQHLVKSLAEQIVYKFG